MTHTEFSIKIERLKKLESKARKIYTNRNYSYEKRLTAVWNSKTRALWYLLHDELSAEKQQWEKYCTNSNFDPRYDFCDMLA